MSRPKVPFRFSPAHFELPPEWLELTYRQRSVIQDVWRIGALHKSGEHVLIETSGQPAQHLTMRLDIKDRRDARNVTEAILQLIDKGFIRIDGANVSVHTSSHRAATEQPVSSHRAATEQPQEVKSTESLESFCRSDQNRKEESVSARTPVPAPAREEQTSFRQPLGEKPGWVADDPKPKSDWGVVFELFAKLRGQPAACVTPDVAAAATVAAAVRAVVGQDDVAFTAEAERLLRAWQADPRAVGHLLSNCVRHLGKYTLRAPVKILPQANPDDERVPHPDVDPEHGITISRKGLAELMEIRARSARRAERLAASA